jgi:hypothetical protein
MNLMVPWEPARISVEAENRCSLTSVAVGVVREVEAGSSSNEGAQVEHVGGGGGGGERKQGGEGGTDGNHGLQAVSEIVTG